MAVGRRCDAGCHSWPDDVEYKRCPVCGEETTRYSNVTPMDESEAAKIKLNYEFEAFYAIYCRHRKQTVDGPLEAGPDEAIWDEKYPGGKPEAAPA